MTRTPPDTIKRKINYNENPFLSKTIMKVIEAKLAEDEDEYRHIYLGEPKEDDESVIIKRSWILAAIDADKKLNITPSGRKRVGFDIADGGPDKCAAVGAVGFHVDFIDEWAAKEDELLKSAGRVHSHARLVGASIDYDSIGVGAFAGAHFAALNEETGIEIDYYGFNAGAGVTNPDEQIDPSDPRSPINIDFYANRKAQAWWSVATRFRNTFNAVTKGAKYDPSEIISISSACDHLDALIDELATPRKDYDNSGKSKVESKKDLAKRDIPSPNIADAFIMALSPRETNGFDPDMWARLAG